MGRICTLFGEFHQGFEFFLKLGFGEERIIEGTIAGCFIGSSLFGFPISVSFYLCLGAALKGASDGCVFILRTGVVVNLNRGDVLILYDLDSGLSLLQFGRGWLLVVLLVWRLSNIGKKIT